MTFSLSCIELKIYYWLLEKCCRVAVIREGGSRERMMGVNGQDDDGIEVKSGNEVR